MLNPVRPPTAAARRAGEGALNSLLELINNPKEFKASIAELETARKATVKAIEAANAAIAAANKREAEIDEKNDILDARDVELIGKQEAFAAAQQRFKAEQDAKLAEHKAREDTLAAARAQHTETAKNLGDLKVSMTSQQSDLDKDKKRLVAKEKALDDRAAELDKVEAGLKKAEADFKSKMDKLKALVG